MKKSLKMPTELMRLKQSMYEKKISYDLLAWNLKSSGSRVSRILNGFQTFRPGELPIVAEVLQLPLKEVENLVK